METLTVLVHQLLTFPALLLAAVVLGLVIFQAVRMLRQRDAVHHEDEHIVPNYDQDA